MKTKTKLSIIIILATVLVFEANIVTVFAATGDFEMERRVVLGYEHHQYTYNNNSTKTLTCNAQYDFSTAPDYYTGLSMNYELNVQVYEQYTGWFGILKWREYGNSYPCTYNNYQFSLSQNVYLPAGTYGFVIYRPFDDYYYVGVDREIVGYIRITGNVQFT